MSHKATINIVLTLGLLGLAPMTAKGQATSDDAKKTVDAPKADSVWTRDKLFGDMGGLRSSLGKHGVSLDLYMSNIYQGVVDGGVDTDSAYGGIIDSVVNIDGHKLGLWKGLSATLGVRDPDLLEHVYCRSVASLLVEVSVELKYFRNLGANAVDRVER